MAPVKMDATELEAAGIRLQTLQASSLSEELRAPGEVVDSAYGTTLITPRVEALVVSRQVRLGDEVRAGEPLVTLASVEVSDAQADLRIAEQEWRRVSALGREAVAGRRINEAKIAVDRARAKAQAYGLPGTTGGSVNGQFTLTAPHAGRITEDDFIVGERIEPGKALFRLVDESVVWVDAKIAPGTVPRIEAGSPATVVIGGQRIAGKVLRSAHRTSDATRNASLRLEVPNDDDLLHGGDFVEVYFEATSSGKGDDSAANQIAVPTDALVLIDGETVAFRLNADGALEPVPV
ncbi:MAG: efflux RND transporter periplasmic adaptor subunit, partial [Dokdonella sp.]